jgi:hypothetical protein
MLKDFYCGVRGKSITVEFGSLSDHKKFTLKSLKTFKGVLERAVDSPIVIEEVETPLTKLLIITVEDANKFPLVGDLVRTQLESIKSICCLDCALENYNSTHTNIKTKWNTTKN